MACVKKRNVFDILMYSMKVILLIYYKNTFQNKVLDKLLIQ